MRNLPRALTLFALSGAIASCLGPAPRDSGTGGAGGGGGGGAGGNRGSGGVVGADAGSGNGGSGVAGGGGSGGTGGMGVVDAGTGGHATDGGTGGAPVDAPIDRPQDVQVVDVRPDTPFDVLLGQTFSNVFAILSSGSDNTPGCARCHDGDAGTIASLPHSMNFANKSAAYLQLVGVASLICNGTDGGGPALARVAPGNANSSELVQKLRQGLGIGTACDGVGMPLNTFGNTDGGSDGASMVVQLTHYAITTAQLQTIVDWINAGAPNN